MLPDEVAGQGDGGLHPDELLLVQRGLAPARLFKYPAAEFPGHERLGPGAGGSHKPPEREPVRLVDPESLRPVKAKPVEAKAPEQQDNGGKPAWKNG
jgi:hypothetical protein